MVISVKVLKPYHIKADANYLYLIVSPAYFTLLINKEEYQFFPIRTREIIINRRTRKIQNSEAEFAFQNCQNVLYVTMVELMNIPEFLILLDHIATPFFVTDSVIQENDKKIIHELEELNIKRLIDKSLDEWDEDAFYRLIKLL